MPVVAELLSQVQSTQFRWLWEPYIPRGKLVLLDGDPGVGKSLFTIDLAARLSRGGALPDGKPGEQPQTAIIVSSEDAVADTIRPRAVAAGADLERIAIARSLEDIPLQLPAELGVLDQLIRKRRAGLVVLDPIMAFLPPEVAANSDQCIRRTLFPLGQLAAETDCTILLVRHLRKKGGEKAIHRGLGSIGMIGAVRSGLLLAIHPGDPDQRVLAVTKTNLARTPPALAFRVASDEQERATIQWTGTVDVTADMLGRPAGLKPRERACLWLTKELAGGPRTVNDLYAAAAQIGIPDVTLKRAKDELGLRSHQVHFKSGQRAWYWYDPCAPWPANAPFKKPFELPPLEPLEPL